MSQKAPWPTSTSKTGLPLDNLMMAYADLSGGKKGASSFKGPALKDVKVEKSQGPSYKPSQKSRDWTSLEQNLEDAFVISSSSSKTTTAPGLLANTSHVIPQPSSSFVSPPATHHNPVCADAPKDEWGDFQDFSAQSQIQRTPQYGKCNLPISHIQSPSEIANIRPFPSSALASSDQTTANVDDDDFSDFVTAAPSKPKPLFSSIPSSTISNISTSSHIIPPPSSSCFLANDSNLKTTGTDLLTSNTIGSRLATFQEESPIHRFKTNNPISFGVSKPLEALNASPYNVQVVQEDDEDDFG